MLEAQITKCCVVQNPETKEKGRVGTVLMGVAEYGDDAINFKVEYDWEVLDFKGFLGDLRETIAQSFDLPVYRVEVKEPMLLEKMRNYHLIAKGQMQ